MLNKTTIALAAIAALALSSAALTPASANYDYCYENPAAANCPGNYDANSEPFSTHVHSYHVHSYKGAAHETSHSTRHHG
jgi:hypothetical protein